jgi:outer membrane lipoprotein-sorting protein
MKKLLTVFLFANLFAYGQFHSGEELLQAMYSKYAGNYCQTIQFDQKTFRYDTNHVLKDTSRWYEWINYPDKFRIDFGKKFGGNCVIFKNDSSFSYKNHKLVKTGTDENDLLLLLGGMYYRKYEDVIARLNKAGYNLKKLKRLPASAGDLFVIGDDNSHQIWVDKADLKVVKLKTKLNENDWLEIMFYDFKRSCNGFTETKVTALKNGRLEQEEVYLNLKTSIVIPDSIFNKK